MKTIQGNISVYVLDVWICRNTTPYTPYMDGSNRALQLMKTWKTFPLFINSLLGKTERMKMFALLF